MNKRTQGIINKLLDSKVTILFVVLCIVGVLASGQTPGYIMNQVTQRIGRNAFLVLALLIPILSGLGLNFGMVIGAMAAQIAIFFAVYYGWTGLPGFFFCLLISTPLAMIFGYLIGKLFNSMRGSEMIGGLILGYFSDGIYQLFFLFLIGTLIPLKSKQLIMSNGVGVKNTIDLKGSLRYVLDDIPGLTMLRVIEFAFYLALVLIAIYVIYHLATKKPLPWKRVAIAAGMAILVFALTFVPGIEKMLSGAHIAKASMLTLVEVCFYATLIALAAFVAYRLLSKKGVDWKRIAIIAGSAVVVYLLTYIAPIEKMLRATTISVVPYLCIALLCVLNMLLLRTRLGQNMRTVGQNIEVAKSAGLNVNRIRIIAIIMSTVLAAWGQLIALQGIGTVATYGSHTNVSLYAIAALLVGGASIHKATNKQAILGVFLFHTLFVVSPLAGKQLFNDAQIGEYFRVFICFGVIALSLAMHAWKTQIKPRFGKPAETEPAKAA